MNLMRSKLSLPWQCVQNAAALVHISAFLSHPVVVMSSLMLFVNYHFCLSFVNNQRIFMLSYIVAFDTIVQY